MSSINPNQEQTYEEQLVSKYTTAIGLPTDQTLSIDEANTLIKTHIVQYYQDRVTVNTEITVYELIKNLASIEYQFENGIRKGLRENNQG